MAEWFKALDCKSSTIVIKGSNPFLNILLIFFKFLVVLFLLVLKNFKYNFFVYFFVYFFVIYW